MKKLFMITTILLAMLPVIYLLMPPVNVERYFSPAVVRIGSESVPEHPIKNLFVGDMHADTLLWNRNIAEPSELGHADIQRLRDANVGLQVFMSVIEAPKDVESNSIEQEGDQITPIVVLDKWPIRSINSYKERALYQAGKLFKAEALSVGNLKVVLSREDLQQSEEWAAGKSPLYAILGLEGAHATEFERSNLLILFEAGYRTMELAHYSDTSFAGSSSGMVKYGLTDNGEKLVQDMNELGMIIDVAHLAPKAIVDVLGVSSQPVFVSHTGIYSTCQKTRNLDDYLIQKIAQQNGIIGIGFFKEALCDNSIEALVEAIKYVRDLVGAKHVSLGSGWDIAPLVMSPRELPLLTQALLDVGFSQDEVRLVMGENVRRFFLNNLPSKENESI